MGSGVAVEVSRRRAWVARISAWQGYAARRDRHRVGLILVSTSAPTAKPRRVVADMFSGSSWK